MRVRERLQSDKKILDHGGNDEWLRGQLEPSSLDLGQIQQVVYDRQKMARGLLRPLERLALFLVQRAENPIDQKRRVAEHGVDRRSELVARRGEEAVARSERAFQLDGLSAERLGVVDPFGDIAHDNRVDALRRARQTRDRALDRKPFAI